MSETEKPNKTGLITAIIAGVVTLSTAVIANVDKFTGKSTEEKKEVVADTISFNYKLDKVIKDCPTNFNSIIGNIQSEDQETKEYYSKVNFDEGITLITFSKDEKPTFNVLAYTGTDNNEILKTKLSLIKKVGDFLKVSPKTTEESEGNSAAQGTVFQKGAVEVTVYEVATLEENVATTMIYLIVNSI